MSGWPVDGVLRKTAKGREALAVRGFTGTRAQRSFLILIDGRKPLKALAAAAQTLGIDAQQIQALLDAGWVEWASKPVVKAGSAPALEHGGLAPNPREQRSLAQAKLYALELATLMVRPQEQAVREAARAVFDETSMKAWLQDIAQRIAEHAGAERAAHFLDKVHAVWPQGLAQTLLQPAE